MRMTLQRKLMFLLACVMLVSVTGLAVLKYSQTKTLAALSRNLTQPFDDRVAVTAAPLNTFVNDYSYWDDLVLFLKTGNTAWASRNFDPCLAGYKANALWIYKADETPVYAANNIGAGDLRALPLPKDAVKTLFAKSRFCRFYVQTSKGLMEIYGATVHPTNDSSRKTEPRGYLLAGRLWNDRFTSDLLRTAGSAVEVTAPDAKYTADALRKDDMVVCRKTLNGWDGTPLMTAWVGTAAPSVKAVERSQSRQFWAAAALIASIIGFFYFFAARWVSRPLGLLYSGLDSGDPAVAGRLCGDRSEFGYIAQLVTKAFEQKELLLAQTSQMKSVHDSVTKDIENLTAQIKELGEESLSLKNSLKQAADHREKAECLAKEVEELRTASRIFKSAYADMERQLEEANGRLEVLNELLQREILNEHEQRDAALTANIEKQNLEAELAKLRGDLEQKERELIDASPLVRPAILLDKKLKSKKKDVPEIPFEARC